MSEVSTLESFTVIRVGMPDVPYCVVVVRTGPQLETGRLMADLDALPSLGCEVELVSNSEAFSTFRCAPVRP